MLEATADDDADDAFYAASPMRCLGTARGSDPSLLSRPFDASGEEVSAMVASSSSCCCIDAGAPICRVRSELPPEPVPEPEVIGDSGGMSTEARGKRGLVRRSNFLLEFLAISTIKCFRIVAIVIGLCSAITGNNL